MIRRYVREPARGFRVSDDYYFEERQTVEVIVCDEEPVDTGLVDEFGVRLFRVRERGKVGF